jgi:hypothetical protein
MSKHTYTQMCVLSNTAQRNTTSLHSPLSRLSLPSSHAPAASPHLLFWVDSTMAHLAVFFVFPSGEREDTPLQRLTPSITVTQIHR